MFETLTRELVAKREENAQRGSAYAGRMIPYSFLPMHNISAGKQSFGPASGNFAGIITPSRKGG
jgi:hypothetical protein